MVQDKMTVKYKTVGFVFKKSDINESDRNFSVFTKDYGRLNIFAKAIRKSVSKLNSGIDIFSTSEIEFIQGKNKKTLTDAQIAEKRGNLCQDLLKFKIANSIAVVLDDFLRGQEKDERIFSLINDIFAKLNYSLQPTHYSLVYYYFLWNFLSLLGYHSEVQKCASCHEKLIPHSLYFSSKDGGIICEKCSVKKEGIIKVNSDVVKILRLILKTDWQILAKLKIEQDSQKLFQEISDNYYDYYLNNSFKNN